METAPAEAAENDPDRTRLDGRRARRLGRDEGLVWLAALLLAAVALWLLSYRTRDPDSRLYSEIAAQLAPRPLTTWIAPSFPPGWYMKGLFREHPAGIFVLPACLGRLGYPPLQAAYLANAVYQALTLILLWRLAATLVAGMESRALTWLLQLLPIAFTYRIRANHEQAVLLCLLLALYGAERARRRPGWSVLIVAGLVGLLLVKGVFVLPGVFACVLWLSLRRGAGQETREWPAWIGLAVCALAVAVAAGGYEQGYRAVTGQPFWSVNLGRQLGVAAVARSSAVLADKAQNLVWYAARVFWFAFPWSAALAALLVARCKRRRKPLARGDRDGLLFALLFTAVVVGAFSLSDRRADRYIFPVYYVVGAAGAIVALRRWDALRRLAASLDRFHPWPTVAVWLVTFALHVLGGRLGLPTVKIWPPGP